VNFGNPKKGLVSKGVGGKGGGRYKKKKGASNKMKKPRKEGGTDAGEHYTIL